MNEMTEYVLILAVTLIHILLHRKDNGTQERNKSRNRKLERAVANAHWIERTHLFDPDEYICSVCGEVSYKPYNVCPCCQIPRRKKIDYHASWVDEIECMSAMMGD